MKVGESCLGCVAFIFGFVAFFEVQVPKQLDGPSYMNQRRWYVV